MKFRLVTILFVVPCAGLWNLPGASADDRKMLCDFEDEDSLRLWEKAAHIELSDENVTHGNKSGKITLRATVVAGSWTGLPSDWSKYDHLKLDFFNPGETVVLAVRMKDGKGKGYDNWNYKVPKGALKAVFDLEKVGAKMDLSDVKQFWFHAVAKSNPPRVIYLDNVRLTRYADAASPGPALAVKPRRGEKFRNIGIGGGGYMNGPAMSPYDNDFMYTDCDMGCSYITKDGGKSWKTIPFYEIAGASGIPAFDKQNIYLKGGGISVSSDKGETWKILREFPWPQKDAFRAFETVGIDCRLLAVGTDHGLWLSGDAGQSWRQSYSGKVVEVASLGNTLFLAGDKSFKISKDLGRTWADISPKEAGGRQITCITAGQEGDTMVLFALLDDNNSLLDTRDWGRSWNKSEIGAAPSRARSMVRMAVNQTRVVFVNRAANSGEELWRSNDSGRSWKRVCYARKGFAPGIKDSEFCGRHKWGLGRLNLAVDRFDTRRVIVTSMSDLFLSTDSGDTWKQMYNDDVGRIDKGSKDFFCRTRGLTMTSAWQYRFDPFDRKYQYICYTDFGFLRSIDSGRSWASSPPANSTYAIQFDPDKPGRVYGAASRVHDIPGWGFVNDKPYKGGRVVYSDDRGDTWHTLGKGFPDKPCTDLALDRTRSKKGRLFFWATFYGDGLYRSNDSGQTWAKVEGLGYPQNKHFLRVKVHPKTGEIYVSISGIKRKYDFFQAGGLWHSSDDGKTWTDIAKSLDLRWQKGFAFLTEKAGAIYLTASTAPKFRQGGVYKTTDNGKSWKQVLDGKTTGNSVIHVFSVDIHPTKPNIVYACTSAGVWCSQDEGQTWKFIKVPHFRTTHVTVDPDDEEIIYVTTFGGGTWVGYYLP